MGYTHFAGGFPGGVTIQNLPVLSGISGSVLWVDNQDSGASDDNDGSFDRPCKTLDAAVGKASQGDLIVLKEGHLESSTTTVIATVDVKGLTIVGLGSGDTRPKLLVGSQLVVSSIGTVFNNLQLESYDDGQDYLVDQNAQATYENCSFIGTSSKQPLTFIDITGTAGSCSNTVIRNCEFISETAGAAAAVSLLEVHDNVRIENSNFIGNFSSGAVIGIAGKIATMVTIKGNTFHNTGAGGAAVMASCTGAFIDNRAYCAGGATLGFNGASLAYHENYLSSALAIAGLLVKNGAFA